MLVGLTAGDESLTIEGSTLVSLAIEGSVADKSDDGYDIMFTDENVGVCDRGSRQKEANNKEIYQMEATEHRRRKMQLGILSTAAQPVGMNECM